jgi:hypothetical protein
VPQQGGGRMRGVEAARHPRRLRAVHRPQVGSERRRRQQPGQLPVVRGDVRAHRMKRRRIRFVEAAANPDMLRCNLEVEAAATHPPERTMREHRRDMGLQRRLVGAEPGIAPWPEHRDLRRGDEFRSARREVDGQLFDDGYQRCMKVGVIVEAACMEPFAAVVALQRPQEAQTAIGERRQARHATILPTAADPPRPWFVP